MDSALIGLVGVLIGILLNETLRRRNRIENYSAKVFEKRLTIYEELFELIRAYSGVADEVIENENLTKEERHQLVSEAIHSVAGFSDENELYLNEEIIVHCVPLMMGVEDIFYIEDENGKKKEIQKFQDNLLAAKRMIRKESGIQDLDNLFGSITKAKHSSPIIDYYRNKKKELNIQGKWL